MDVAVSVLDELRTALGPGAVVPGSDAEPRHLGGGGVRAPAGTLPLAVAYPRDPAEVAAVLRTCHARRVPVVPQGGLTGLVGGATPVAGCVALSLERMR